MFHLYLIGCFVGGLINYLLAFTRYEETSTASTLKSSSPSPSTPHQETTTTNPPAPKSSSSAFVHPLASVHATEEKELGGFDEFDPLGSCTGNFVDLNFKTILGYSSFQTQKIDYS